MWKNPERKKEYQRNYYLANKEKIITHNRAWRKKDYQSNPEKYRKRSQEYRLQNLEYYRKYRREWRKFNPSGIYNVIVESARRRKKLVAITKKQFIEWWNRQEKKCFYCSVMVEKLKRIKDSMASWCDRLTVDRLDNDKPYQLNNIVLSCHRCNSIKGDLFTWEEMKEIGEKYVKPKRLSK